MTLLALLIVCTSIAGFLGVVVEAICVIIWVDKCSDCDECNCITCQDLKQNESSK